MDVSSQRRADLTLQCSYVPCSFISSMSRPGKARRMLNEGGLFVLGAAPIPSVSALGSAVLQPRMKAPFVYDPKAPVCQPLGCQGRCRGHLDVTVYGDTAGERGQEQDEAWAAALHCRYRYQRRTQGQVCVWLVRLCWCPSLRCWGLRQLMLLAPWLCASSGVAGHGVGALWRTNRRSVKPWLNLSRRRRSALVADA